MKLNSSTRLHKVLVFKQAAHMCGFVFKSNKQRVLLKRMETSIAHKEISKSDVTEILAREISYTEELNTRSGVSLWVVGYGVLGSVWLLFDVFNETKTLVDNANIFLFTLLFLFIWRNITSLSTILFVHRSSDFIQPWSGERYESSVDQLTSRGRIISLILESFFVIFAVHKYDLSILGITYVEYFYYITFLFCLLVIFEQLRDSQVKRMNLISNSTRAFFLLFVTLPSVVVVFLVPWSSHVVNHFYDLRLAALLFVIMQLVFVFLEKYFHDNSKIEILHNIRRDLDFSSINPAIALLQVERLVRGRTQQYLAEKRIFEAVRLSEEIQKDLNQYYDFVERINKNRKYYVESSSKSFRKTRVLLFISFLLSAASIFQKRVDRKFKQVEDLIDKVLILNSLNQNEDDANHNTSRDSVLIRYHISSLTEIVKKIRNRYEIENKKLKNTKTE